ncbi:MAG: hypothetical protein WAK31_27585 [Chthoniobacterales bacterium]
MEAWQFLVDHAKDYGFLGPIVGIVGLLLGASGAIAFGWARALDTWKPPNDTFPAGLDKMVAMLCGVALFVIWLLADPKHGPDYLRAAIWLAIGSLVAFLCYIGLRNFCGRFRKPRVDANNQPAGEDPMWGGFWIRSHWKKEVKSGTPVEDILRGVLYDRSKVWPPFSLTLSAVVTALVLICVLVFGTCALSTAGACVQVALTGKPAREIFNISQVSALSSPAPSSTQPTPSATDPH